MHQFNRPLALAVLAVTLTAGIAAAQQTSTPPASVPAKPAPAAKTDGKAEPSAAVSTWDQTKTMTRKQWDTAKKKWETEKVQWQVCNRQADAEKLKAPKSWSFIASCMTKT